jgi:hypothetical protein
MTRVTYIDFQSNLSPFGVFSVNDIIKNYPSFDVRRLNEWQKKGYIKKLVNKWYEFSNLKNTEELLWWESNRLVQPSYISLESALSYYGFIPEGVFSVTAITSSKTNKIDTGENHLIYRNIKPSLFFGYKIIQYKNSDISWPIKFATPEKAILDYLYLNPNIKTVDDMEGLRLNRGKINSQVNWRVFDNFLQIFNSKQLDKRVNLLKEYLNYGSKLQNLVKFTLSQKGCAIENALSKIDHRRNDYRQFNYYEKREIATTLLNLFNEEFKNLVLEFKNVHPSDKFQYTDKHIKALALLESTVLALKSYIECFTKFFTAYLEDLSLNPTKNKKKLYKNLERLFNCGLDNSGLLSLKDLRDVFAHGESYNFAIKKNQNSFVPCLIKITFLDNEEYQETEISYDYINQSILSAKKIEEAFYKFIEQDK